MDFELATGSGAAQLALDRQLVANLGVHAFGEEGVVVAADFLGTEQRRIGVAHQFIEAGAVGRADGNADAGGQRNLLAVDHQFLAQAGQDFLRQRQRVVELRVILQDDLEFVAALAGDGVAFAHGLGQEARHHLQRLVAHLRTVGVVDALEAIQVQAHHGHALAFALGGGVHLLEALARQQAVRQAGQRVVIGQEIDQVLLGLALGDVHEHHHEVLRMAFAVAHHGHAEQARIGVAILASRQDLAGPVAGVFQRLHQQLVGRRVLLAGVQQRHAAAHHLVGAVAGNLGEGGIAGDDVAGAVGDHDGVQRGLEHAAGQAQEFLVGAALLDFLLQRLGQLRQFGGALADALLQVGTLLGQRLLRAPQAYVGVGAGQDFLSLEGFGDEVHAAQRKAAHLVLSVMLGRQEDHRHLAQFRRRFQAAAHFKAVDAGHAHVEQYQFRGTRLSRPQRQLAVRRLTHVVARFGQQVAQQFERGRRIFHDQHFALGMVFRQIPVHVKLFRPNPRRYGTSNNSI